MLPVNMNTDFVSSCNLDQIFFTQIPFDTDLAREWRTWASYAQSGTYEDRNTAVQRLINFVTEVSTPPYLNLSGLDLTELPPLPDGIKELYISGNKLTSLPENLPASLITLIACNNQLTRLPNQLPERLQSLHVSSNQLTSLPDPLPPELYLLDIGNNQFTQLPNNLPSRLRTLRVHDNHLTSLPRSLPDKLYSLNIENNPFIEGAVDLSRFLSIPYFDYTADSFLPFRVGFESEIHYPYGPDETISQFSTGCTDISAFVGALSQWSKEINIKQWKKISLERNATAFYCFLKKLYNKNDTPSAHLKQKMADWLNYLAKDSSIELRKQTFAIAREGAENCVDRASYYFNELYLLMLQDRLVEEKSSIAETFTALRSIFRMQELDKIAACHAAQRRIKSLGFNEDIKIYFAYQYYLRKQLALPIYTKLRHAVLADVSVSDVKNAKKKVLMEEKQHFLRYLVNDCDVWHQRIKKWNKEQLMHTEAQFLEKIEEMISHTTSKYEINRKEETDALKYECYFPLTKDFLQAHNALSLLDVFLGEEEHTTLCDRCVVS